MVASTVPPAPVGAGFFDSFDLRFQPTMVRLGDRLRFNHLTDNGQWGADEYAIVTEFSRTVHPQGWVTIHFSPDPKRFADQQAKPGYFEASTVVSYGTFAPIREAGFLSPPDLSVTHCPATGLYLDEPIEQPAVVGTAIAEVVEGEEVAEPLEFALPATLKPFLPIRFERVTDDLILVVLD